MRYELADYEWLAIKPMLPNKSRGGKIAPSNTMANRHEAKLGRYAEAHAQDEVAANAAVTKSDSFLAASESSKR